MGPVAGLIIRAGCSLAAFCLYLLVLLLFFERSASWILVWPIVTGYALMVAGWYGVLGLAVGSYAMSLLIRKTIIALGKPIRFEAALFIVGDFAAGATVSATFYAGNEFYVMSGFVIAAMFAVMFRLIHRLPHYKIDVPSVD